MLVGHRTWLFNHQPVILSTGVVGGPYEAKGNLINDFDLLHDNLWLEKDSFEKAQQKMMEEANDIALKKMNMTKEQIDFFISGDLINQITPSNFAAKTLNLPFFGLFSACATSMQGLALGAFIINGKGANYILTGTASHHAATERQFRFPNEYGGQKPPTAQWTVTGAGCALIANEGQGPVITSATIGKVIDLGISDPFNMGGAMAPAAVDTIIAHLKERNVDHTYYDLIVTGDLGKVGREVSLDLLHQNNIQIDDDRYVDCGVLIYRDDQPVLAGGSGAACSSTVIYGHLMKRLREGEIKRILAVATGSLHSPLSIQQKNTIPTIAHAVSIEIGSEQV